MSTSSVKSNTQLNYDVSNLKNDAKEIAWIKKQADAAPNHQISDKLAEQLHTAQQNYANNLQAVSVDMGTVGPNDKASLAHTADLVNALTNGVKDTSMSLESGNNLDGALKDIGDTAGGLHQRLDQITLANTNMQNVSNALAPNADPSNAQAEQDATQLTSSINAESTEPYASGHAAAPQGGYDVYDAGSSAKNPTGALKPTTDTQSTVWGGANELGVLGTAAQYAPGGLHGSAGSQGTGGTGSTGGTDGSVSGNLQTGQVTTTPGTNGGEFPSDAAAVASAATSGNSSALSGAVSKAFSAYVSAHPGEDGQTLRSDFKAALVNAGASDADKHTIAAAVDKFFAPDPNVVAL